MGVKIASGDCGSSCRKEPRSRFAIWIGLIFLLGLVLIAVGGCMDFYTYNRYGVAILLLGIAIGAGSLLLIVISMCKET